MHSEREHRAERGSSTAHGCCANRLWIWMLFACAGTGCGDGARSPLRPHDTPDPASANPCGDAAPALAAQDAAQLFEAVSVPTFDFYMPAERWEELKANARDEQYVEAQACFDGRSLGVVGLRFKGSYGSLHNCFDGSGNRVCRKLGMKVKFDEYDEDKRFHGLKRLNFHSYRYDASYLKEKLSLDLYRAMGLTAPRAAWALLRVNAEDQGLFGMVEQIDGRFTADRWPEHGDGNLYKEVWPGETHEPTIRAHLETNEDSADVSRFLTFSEALDAARAAELRTVLGEYTDLDQLARYMAVDDAIANFDGVITYYTSGTVDRARNHNFYFYEEADGRFTLIPWDLESTLSLASSYGVVPTWRETPANCATTYAVWSGQSRVMAPGCDRVFQALAADLDGYERAARELLDGPFAVARMNELVDRHASSIRSAATSDLHGAGAGRFEQEVSFLKKQFPELRRRLEHFLTGAPSTPLVLDPEALGGFETADDFGIYSGTTLLSNAATSASVELDTSAAISGAQSLRMRFDFRNEAEPWGQWMFYTIPFAAVPADLTTRRSLRFKVRSNVPRTFRVEIESPANSRGNEGIKVGWDIAIAAETSEVTVAFADATVPSWASDPGDDLATILESASGISLKPECVNRDGSGQLPAGTADMGWVDVDDIEFL